ncbi:MAG: hypothetical protein FWB80_00095 [Defluviitaleaceae bacterium]|nr:hypothetical protein [Defluviitaleaceae bacterium]
MTIKELEQFRHLQHEVRGLIQRIEKLQTMSKDIVSDSVKNSNGGILVITGLDVRSAVKSKKLEKILQERAVHLKRELLRIETFISTVTKSEIRRIIDYRYLQCLQWDDVAKKVYGHATEDTPRKALKRYLREF